MLVFLDSKWVGVDGAWYIFLFSALDEIVLSLLFDVFCDFAPDDEVGVFLGAIYEDFDWLIDDGFGDLALDDCEW